MGGPFSGTFAAGLSLDILSLQSWTVGTKGTSVTGRRSAVEAYCMKCRAKREMRDAKAITMKNGKPATQGVCPTCGTKMFRIGRG